MLSDDIIAAAGRPGSPNAGHIARLAEEIKGAMRFDVRPEVIASINAVLNLSLESQTKALRLCRLPARKVWLEWSIGKGVREGVLISTEDDTVQRGTCVGAAPAGGIRP